MFCQSLAENLIKAGLQPASYCKTNKKIYFNNAYFENKEKTGQTFGNTDFLFDYRKYTKYKEQDANNAIVLKNENLIELNRGYIMLDFDLKGKENISIFDDIVLRFKELELWEQVEHKRNNTGYHLVLRMNPDEIAAISAQCKIYRGEKSFLEVIAAGKFFRLCPNQDYIIDDTEGKYIDFSKVKYIKLQDLLSFSKRKEDRVLKQNTFKRVKNISNEKVNFEITDLELETENEKLLYSYIKSKKLDYDEAVKLSYGLGVYKYIKLFEKTIPPSKRHEYVNLFEKGYNSGLKTTQFMNELLNGLHINKNKIQISKYIPQEKMEEILLDKKKHVLISAPTGSGKTTAILNAALKLNLKVLFTVPNKAVVAQIKKERGFDLGASYEHFPIMEQIEQYNIVVSTINKIEQIPEYFDLSEYILICDEKHTHITTVDFRAEHIYMINKIKERFKKVIDVTATVEPLYLDDYEEKIYFIKSDDKQYDINITVTEINNKEKHKNRNKSAANSKRVLIDLLRKYEYTKCIVLNNDIVFNDVFAEQNKDIYLSLNSKTKKSEHYTYILENQRIPEKIKVLLTTDLFSAGLNLLNDEEIIVIINGFIDPTLIKQFVARFRKRDKIKVELIISPREIKNIYREGLIEIIKTESMHKMNELKKESGAIFFNKPIVQDEYFVYDKKTKQLEVFNEKIYQYSWHLYCKHLDYKDLLLCFDEGTYKININSNSLENIYDIKDRVKEEKENRKEIKIKKKEKTIELIKEYTIFVEQIFDEEEHCSDTLDFFMDLYERCGLPVDLCLRFIEDENFHEYVRHTLLVRFTDKSKTKKTDFVKMVLNIYWKYEKGQKIKIGETCERNNYNREKYKNALFSLWETEEKRNGKERYLELIQRRKVKLSTIEQFYLFRSERFGRTFFNELSEEEYEELKQKIQNYKREITQ